MSVITETTGTTMQIPRRIDRNDTSAMEGWKWGYQLTSNPDLTLAELLDLIATEKELQESQGKRFKDSKTLFEDLDSSDQK